LVVAHRVASYHECKKIHCSSSGDGGHYPDLITIRERLVETSEPAHIHTVQEDAHPQ